MIAIIGAMEIEIEGIKAELADVKCKTISSMNFYEGTLFGKPVVVAKCSPGKVNAAICAQTMILNFNLEYIINPGVAGGIGKDVHIGDLVIGTACVQHDMDSTFLGDPLGEIPMDNGNRVFLPCSKEISDIYYNHAIKTYSGSINRGVIATGDQFIADSEKCDCLKRDFNAIACEMESGSIAQVACLAGVPFVALRSISDNANEGGKVDFLTFARESADKTVKLLNSVIKSGD